MTRLVMRAAAAGTLAAAGFVCLAGCRTVGADGGPDMAFVRTPDAERETAPALTDAVGLLFPAGSSRRWEMAVAVRQMPREPGAPGADEPQVVQQMTEQIRVGPPKAVGGVRNATTLEMRRNGSASVYREESYVVAGGSIKLVAAGGDDKMVMSPPMPLVDTKQPQCREFKWRGSILFKGAEAPATAYSRIGPKEKVTTPAGTFDAYRVDTALTTIIEGRSITFPASRWFSPGVGIVKQRFRIGDAEVLKVLTNYKE
jgi:hypothetical protein